LSTGAARNVVDRVRADFRGVHGSEDDAAWASTAAMALVWKDVKEPYVETVLGAAAQTLLESGEPAEAAFGDPRAWADAQLAWLRSEGFDALDSRSGPVPLRVAVENCLWLAAWFGLLFGVVQLVDLLPGREPWELTTVRALCPALLAACCSITYGVYAWVRPRRPFAESIVLTALPMAVCTCATAVLLMVLGEVGPRLPWPWTFALAPAYGLLAWMVGVLPSRASTTEPVTEDLVASRALDTEGFSRRLAAALRSRDDLGDATIDATVAEARSHLEDSGNSAAVEFGSPEGYANTVPTDARVRPRRTMLLYGSLVCAWSILLVAEAAEHGVTLSWALGTYAALVLLCVWGWINAYKDWRRATHARNASSGRRSGD
jgi:hypothetical protein